MTTTRRAHQCTHCDSPAAFIAHLHVRYGYKLKAVEHLVSTVRACDTKECRKKANDMILSPANRRVIRQKLATIGRLNPDFDNAMIEFVPIGEASWGPEKMQKVDVGLATAGSA